MQALEFLYALAFGTPGSIPFVGPGPVAAPLVTSTSTYFQRK